MFDILYNTMAKKITETELENAIAKMRQKYNDIIVTYMLSPQLKNGFEERLFTVRLTNYNILRFLTEELKDIRLIENREKEKINLNALKNIAKIGEKETSAENGQDKKDFADKIIEQMMSRIEHYPDIFIHKNASKEIEKLFGTLIEFDVKHWSVYGKYAKKYRVNKYDADYSQLESMLNNFTRIYKGDLPSRLSRYRSMLDSSFIFSKDVAREEKSCIVDCAVLISALRKMLGSLISNQELLPEEKEKLSEIDKYLDLMAENFRLRDIIRLIAPPI